MSGLQNTRQKLKIAFIAAGRDRPGGSGDSAFSHCRIADARRQQLDSLWKDLQQKTRQVEPLRGMDKKIVLAQHADQWFL